MSKLKVGIIGANGYAGAELVRLLLNHPNVEIAAIHARSDEGKSLASVYPGFQKISNLIFEDEHSVVNKSDFIFASLPHGLSEPLARKCINQNKKFIDLGNNDVEIEWTAKNLSNETITNKYLNMNIYNCEDNSIVLMAAMYFDEFHAGDTWFIYTSGGKPIDYFKYYIELSLEDNLEG